MLSCLVGSLVSLPVKCRAVLSLNLVGRVQPGIHQVFTLENGWFIVARIEVSHDNGNGIKVLLLLGLLQHLELAYDCTKFPLSRLCAISGFSGRAVSLVGWQVNIGHVEDSVIPHQGDKESPVAALINTQVQSFASLKRIGLPKNQISIGLDSTQIVGHCRKYILILYPLALLKLLDKSWSHFLQGNDACAFHLQFIEKPLPSGDCAVLLIQQSVISLNQFITLIAMQIEQNIPGNEFKFAGILVVLLRIGILKS
mmetsp:Transcript_7150/g.16756  ORF Transcript_7150/g.16756 Transcript_7150/m.16756 type:complete len:255 (+) Transcript_7150:3929-4693(+)